MQQDNNPNNSVSTEFEAAADKTYLTSEFEKSSPEDVKVVTSDSDTISKDETPDATYDLEDDLKTLGGNRGDSAIAGYQSFADEVEAREASSLTNGDAFQEFQEEQRVQQSLEGSEQSPTTRGMSNDISLSL